jgi:hypothetical protein
LINLDDSVKHIWEKKRRVASGVLEIVTHETEVSNGPDSVRAKMKAVWLIDPDYLVTFSTDP